MGIFDSLFGNKKRVNSDKTDALKQFGMSESHKDFSLQDRRWKDSLTYQHQILQISTLCLIFY